MAQLRACERQVEDIKPEVEEETKQSSCPPTAISDQFVNGDERISFDA
jgi:hypothetical protein